MYSTVSTGPSHMESPTGFSQAPLKQSFPTFHYRTSSLCCLPIFFHYNTPSPLQMIHKISRGPDKPHTLFFLLQTKFPKAGTPPKLHEVSIDPDVPPLMN